jgi:hypothetical protein
VPGKGKNMGVRTTRSTKAKGCASIKHLIENDQIIIPDFQIIEELSNFKKIGNTFRCEDGQNDDIVMTLVIFGWLCKQTQFEELSETKAEAKEEEEFILPIVHDGMNDVNSFVDSGLVWTRVDASFGAILPIYNC